MIKKIVGKILKGIETIGQKDKKLTLCKLNSKIQSYKKLTNNAIETLLDELSTRDRERNE